MKILKYIILSFFGLFFTAGCSDWLEVKPYDTMAEGVEYRRRFQEIA